MGYLKLKMTISLMIPISCICIIHIAYIVVLNKIKLQRWLQIEEKDITRYLSMDKKNEIYIVRYLSVDKNNKSIICQDYSLSIFTFFLILKNQKRGASIGRLIILPILFVLIRFEMIVRDFSYDIIHFGDIIHCRVSCVISIQLNFVFDLQALES